MRQQIEPLTEKQWEEIWKYFGFSKKRRIYYNVHGWKHRLVVVVSPDNKIHEEELEGWPGEKVSIYPKPTFENIYKWILPQCSKWSIEVGIETTDPKIVKINIGKWFGEYEMDDMSSNKELAICFGDLLYTIVNY
jgi:hypothetical protein